jgi:hypothetical protein
MLFTLQLNQNCVPRITLNAKRFLFPSLKGSPCAFVDQKVHKLHHLLCISLLFAFLLFSRHSQRFYLYVSIILNFVQQYLRYHLEPHWPFILRVICLSLPSPIIYMVQMTEVMHARFKCSRLHHFVFLQFGVFSCV